MDPRLVVALAFLTVPLLPAAASHAGQADAAHPCPDVATVWGHGHEAAGDRFLWLDTHAQTVHGPTGAAFWSAADGDNRSFALLLDPPIAFPTALDEDGTILIEVAGRAESATGPVLPGPVQTVLDVLLGVDQVPGAVQDALRDVRYEGAQNVGPADVTIHADLVAGGAVVATGQASGVHTQPDDTLGVPPSPGSVEGVQPPEPPRDSPVDPPPVHEAGDRALFRATLELTPGVTMLEPGEPVWLNLTRSEPFAWDLVLGGDEGLRMGLPIVDHAFGPVCPEWEVPPVNVTVDAPSKTTVAPGDAATFPIHLENPARIAQDVQFRFAGGDYGVVRGVIEDAHDGVVTVDGYEDRTVEASYQVAENAVERTYRLTMHAMYNNTTVEHVTQVVVEHAEPEPSPSPTPSPTPSLAPSGPGGGAGGASSEQAAGQPADQQFDAGGNSPGVGALAAAAAVAAGLAAVRRRR